MPADPLLFDRLRSYLARHLGLQAPGPCPESAWPEPMLHWKAGFSSFEWLCTDDKRMFGIRPLVGQAPFRLSELRARGFRTESVRHPVRPPVVGSLEHYLIAELLTSDAAVVFLCMYAQSQDWYVLDEHRIGRA